MLNSLGYSCTFDLKQNDSHSMFCRVNCFWLSSISDKYIWPDSVAKRFQNRSILLEYTKRPKSSELPGAPPLGAHSELFSPRYAPTFLNWSTQKKKKKKKRKKKEKKKEKKKRKKRFRGPCKNLSTAISQTQYVRLSQSWALSWIYLPLCNRPIFMQKSLFMYLLISNKVTVTVYFAQ